MLCYFRMNIMHSSDIIYNSRIRLATNVFEMLMTSCQTAATIDIRSLDLYRSAYPDFASLRNPWTASFSIILTSFLRVCLINNILLQATICHLRTLTPRQNGHRFSDDIFNRSFNENCCILIKISLKYVIKGPIDNIAALVQIMAWRRTGDKPLSEVMMAEFGNIRISATLS